MGIGNNDDLQNPVEDHDEVVDLNHGGEKSHRFHKKCLLVSLISHWTITKLMFSSDLLYCSVNHQTGNEIEGAQKAINLSIVQDRDCIGYLINWEESNCQSGLWSFQLLIDIVCLIIYISGRDLGLKSHFKIIGNMVQKEWNDIDISQMKVDFDHFLPNLHHHSFEITLPRTASELRTVESRWGGQWVTC